MRSASDDNGERQEGMMASPTMQINENDGVWGCTRRWRPAQGIRFAPHHLWEVVVANTVTWSQQDLEDGTDSLRWRQ